MEAGAWRDPEDYPHSAYGGMRDLMEDWSAQVTRGRALWPVVQARTMGGTTVVNSAICVRTPDDIFEQWEREHGLKDLKARVLAAEDQVEREITVEEVPPASRGLSNILAKLGTRDRTRAVLKAITLTLTGDDYVVTVTGAPAPDEPGASTTAQPLDVLGSDGG